jgi:hypothetical protein
MKIKCNKCDERGYIVESQFPSYSAHSCDCGWAVEQSLKKFENVSIGDLLNYAQKRVAEKEKLCTEI